MLEFNSSLIPFLPYFLIVIFLIKALWKKEMFLAPTVLAFSLASGPLVFDFVRAGTVNYENFEVGYSIGMYASIVATIPLAWFGWIFGRKLKPHFVILLSVAGLLSNYSIAYAYQQMIKKNAETLKAEVVFDCEKLPFHCAIRDGKLDDIATLKNNGKNIEARDILSRSPLWYGINNEEAVKVLLENGANPDSFNMKGETPLSYVLVFTFKPNIAIAKLLVKYGANINRTIGFRKNISILNFAIVNKNKEVILFILENGGDPYALDGYKKTSCQRFSKMGREESLDYIKFCPDLK